MSKNTYKTDKARVIITLACDKNCLYCCNKYPHILSQAILLTDFSQLEEHNEIVITGGEPALNINKTIEIINKINKINPLSKKYLYSAKYSSPYFKSIVDIIDGFHFTLHKSSTIPDINDFEWLQRDIKFYGYLKSQSFQLCIDPTIKFSINIFPYLWNKIKIKEWKNENECRIPDNETLYRII